MTLTSTHVLAKLEEHDWGAQLVLHLLKTQRQSSDCGWTKERHHSFVTVDCELYVMPTLRTIRKGCDASMARRVSNSVFMPNEYRARRCSPKEMGHCLKRHNVVCRRLSFEYKTKGNY